MRSLCPPWRQAICHADDCRVQEPVFLEDSQEVHVHGDTHRVYGEDYEPGVANVQPQLKVVSGNDKGDAAQSGHGDKDAPEHKDSTLLIRVSAHRQTRDEEHQEVGGDDDAFKPVDRR
eukprot:scaffold271749_cov33-Tisochrysis_lutea.AAC.2